jgi:tetratricopeptide (TPR) repeat protein
MTVFPFSRLSQRTVWFKSTILAAGLIGVCALTTPAQEPGTEPTESTPAVRQVTQTDGTFSISAADALAAQASQSIATQDYSRAIENLQKARELYNQLSTYYQELASMFVGVDSRINTSHRAKALETAQKRDQATYQLALLYRTQNRPDLAVPLLMEILRSQQPTRELGQRAYQQLFELGFVDVPYSPN